MLLTGDCGQDVGVVVKGVLELGHRRQDDGRRRRVEVGDGDVVILLPKIVNLVLAQRRHL